MPLFRVVLRGHLPPVSGQAEPRPAGFLVTRWVTAATQAAAAEAAVRLVRSEAKYHELVLAYRRAPDLTVDEVDEGDAARAAKANPSGYTFFDEG
jgi:hypothetical protein